MTDDAEKNEGVRGIKEAREETEYSYSSLVIYSLKPLGVTLTFEQPELEDAPVLSPAPHMTAAAVVVDDEQFEPLSSPGPGGLPQALPLLLLPQLLLLICSSIATILTLFPHPTSPPAPDEVPPVIPLVLIPIPPATTQLLFQLRFWLFSISPHKLLPLLVASSAAVVAAGAFEEPLWSCLRPLSNEVILLNSTVPTVLLWLLATTNAATELPLLLLSVGTTRTRLLHLS